MTMLTEVRLEDVGAHVPALLAPALEASARNSENISVAAAEIATRIQRGGRLFGYGAGHAYAFAAELCSRAGGLPMWTSMNLDDLRTSPRPAHEQLRDSFPERDPANGIALAERHGLADGDVLAIGSQSGRNGSAVEMAMWGRDRGVYVLGVVSKAHSAAFPSRHPSGRKLAEVCDLSLDLCTPVGDAALLASGGERVAATSTIAFALLAQLLSARVALALEEQGAEIPVISSANVGE